MCYITSQKDAAQKVDDAEKKVCVDIWFHCLVIAKKLKKNSSQGQL